MSMCWPVLHVTSSCLFIPCEHQTKPTCPLFPSFFQHPVDLLSLSHPAPPPLSLPRALPSPARLRPAQRSATRSGDRRLLGLGDLIADRLREAGVVGPPASVGASVVRADGDPPNPGAARAAVGGGVCKNAGRGRVWEAVFLGRRVEVSAQHKGKGPLQIACKRNLHNRKPRCQERKHTSNLNKTTNTGHGETASIYC